MGDSPAAVAAAQEALGCERRVLDQHEVCLMHLGPDGMLIDWTDAGCPVAVEVASKVAAATLRVHRSRRYCGCGWCCANNAPGVVPGDAHKNCSAQRARADEQETP